MPAKYTNEKSKVMMKSQNLPLFLFIGLMSYALFLSGCVPNPVPTPESRAKAFIEEQSGGAEDGKDIINKADSVASAQLPVRYQRPAYSVSPSSNALFNSGSVDSSIPVGDVFSKESKTPDDTYSKGPISLSTILNELVKGKKIARGQNVSLSWARDANRNAQVYVTIKSTDDLFVTIDNILRQLDYSYELQGSTIIINNKQTKRFHIAMPFMASTFSTGVGGNVLGSSGGNMSGTLNIDSSDNQFDIWLNIQTNLDKILEIWTTSESSSPEATVTAGAATTDAAATDTSNTEAVAAVAAPSPPSGQGYYTIDRPIGMITVTAPRSLLNKIDDYLTNLKKELYRQVSIEAKIVEVTLTNDNTTGIDWSNILASTAGFGLNLDFAKTGIIKSSTANTIKQSSTADGGSFFTLNAFNFNLLIDAMKSQGHVEILSNPRISVMNGQPAMISIGDNVTFVSAVSSTTTDGVTTTSASTSSVMSGLGLGVVASVLNDDEVILSITPVTSSLSQPIEYKTFGTNQVGLPQVTLREINTIVRVRDGEMLVVGGLIDNTSTDSNSYVAGLGEVPVAGQLFRKDGKVTSKRELVILLRPKIISL